MLDSDRDRHLLYARYFLRRLVDDLGPLTKALDQGLAGFPAGHEGGSPPKMCDACKGNGSVEGDLGLLEECDECEARGYLTDSWDSRTQAAAMTPDDARRDQAKLADYVYNARHNAELANDLRVKWLSVSTAKAESEGEPGCKSCARLPDEVQEVHRSGLCRWCYDHYLAEIDIDGVVVKPANQMVPFEILTIRRRLMRNVTTKDWRDWYRVHGQHRKKAS